MLSQLEPLPLAVVYRADPEGHRARDLAMSLTGEKVIPTPQLGSTVALSLEIWVWVSQP